MGSTNQIKRLRIKKQKLACPFNGNPDLVNYKDVYNLRKKFITTRGRILPAEKTGVSRRCQRKLTVAIARARYMALIPYVNYT
jgi:small subunit ribosomal protein S18